MAPTVYSEYTNAPPAAPLFLLVHSALYLLPSPVTHSPSISVNSPLIRILRANPPNSSFHSGLAFSPSAKRTIGWEGQNKRPPCWWCAVLDPGACFLSLSLSLCFFFLSPFPLAETDGYSSSLVSLTSCAFSPHLPCFLSALSSHFSLPDTPSMHICPPDHLWICFSINKFLSLTNANAVLQTELNLTTNTSNFCWSRY